MDQAFPRAWGLEGAQEGSEGRREAHPWGGMAGGVGAGVPAEPLRAPNLA